MESKRWPSCGAQASRPRRASTSSSRASTPSTSQRPSTGGMCPSSVARVVDLPMPLGPSSTIHSPRPAAAFTGPNRRAPSPGHAATSPSSSIRPIGPGSLPRSASAARPASAIGSILARAARRAGHCWIASTCAENGSPRPIGTSTSTASRVPASVPAATASSPARSMSALVARAVPIATPCPRPSAAAERRARIAATRSSSRRRSSAAGAAPPTRSSSAAVTIAANQRTTAARDSLSPFDAARSASSAAAGASRRPPTTANAIGATAGGWISQAVTSTAAPVVVATSGGMTTRGMRSRTRSAEPTRCSSAVAPVASPREPSPRRARPRQRVIRRSAMLRSTASWVTSRSAYRSAARPRPKKRTPTIATERSMIDGCSLARTMSQPETAVSAIAKPVTISPASGASHLRTFSTWASTTSTMRPRSSIRRSAIAKASVVAG